MKITIGGDFCITPNYLTHSLFDEALLQIFKISDFNIVNLECPVTIDDQRNKILKTGPHLRTDKAIFDHLETLNIHAVALANNHIMDYGEKGLMDTIGECEKRNILFVGAGRNRNAAEKALVIEKENIRIAIINFCENEWSIANPTSGGANPMDLIDNVKQIKSAKQIADFVIIIVHGGHESFLIPSPRVIKQYRFYAENGADAVIGHHTHFISGYEMYQNVPIIYSLGNMIFTYKSKEEAWYTGLIAQLDIEYGKPIKYEIIPIKQVKQSFKTTLPEASERNEIEKQLSKINKTLENPQELNHEWIKFLANRESMLNHFSPVNAIPYRYLRSGLIRLGINKLFLKTRYLKTILNLIRCEAHRDVIIELLKKKLL
jgi:poly-gamma-glutamate capsule biosynthesis protein CapA/YwtB (metallophosphatase superfamily)